MNIYFNLYVTMLHKKFEPSTMKHINIFKHIRQKKKNIYVVQYI